MSIHRSLFRALSIVVILSMSFSGITPSPVSAQGPDGIERQLNAQTGKVSFLGPEDGQILPAAEALGKSTRPQDPAMALAKRFGPEFGLQDAERELAEIKTSHTENGRITARYQQTYQGVPVMGGELIVNTNANGDLYSMNGEVSSKLSLSTRPAISSAQAQQTALQALAKWYQKSSKDFIASEPKLWIYDESLLRPSTRPAELVWRIEITAKEASLSIRELVLVHAQRGSLSLHFNQIDTAWSVRGSSGAVQDPDVTPTPSPTATPQATPTSLPIEESLPAEELTTPEMSSADAASPDGALWYVATTGNNSNTCATPASPCQTINGALAKAGTGDIIRVTSGTYTGSGGNVVIISKSITLSGGWDTTFTNQNGASIIDGGALNNGILANTPGSTVVVEYFVIRNSYTVMDSGGIYLFGANFTLRNSAVINNDAGARGAGIFLINNASLTLLNSTISGNAAATSGGGIYAVNGSITINNSTIANNSSNSAGGGITRESGTLSIRNSILAKNTTTGSSPDCSGSIFASDHNIIGNTSGCTVTAGTGDQFNVDPQIDLSLSGTLPLHALLANSPAINAGDNATCLTIDQRGVARPSGSACDIGAYEHAATGGLFAVSGSNQTARPGMAFALPFKVYLLDNSANPVAGVTVTFTAPNSGASGTFADSGTNVTTAVTDSNGYATSAVFTANGLGGAYTVSVTADGYGYSTAFSLTNSLADLYVTPGGSDSNTCTSPASPCQTINAAINKAIAGNTIAVANGTYTGTGTYVVYINKALTLSGGWEANFSQQTGWSIIDGQNARTGMAVFNINSGVIGSTVDHFKFTNGYSANSAGGIYAHVPLVLNNSIVIRNRTGGGSSGAVGGIFASSELTLNNTTVQENVSPNQAGGILIYVSNKLTVNNSTITGNQAVGGSGGGILLSGGSGGTGQVTNISNSTIANNSARYGGGISIQGWSPSRTVTIKNSIIAKNNATYNGPDCMGTVSVLDHSVIGNTTDCTVSTGSGNLVNVNPLISLYPIGVWGLHSLHIDSPARDAGASCLPTDQRGVSRPQGAACDMGAYEYTTPGAASSFGIAGGSNQRTPTSLAFANPLAVYVVDNNGNPVSGVTVTFTAPATGPSGTFATGTNTSTISTDSTGLAITPIFTANSQLGTYNVTATASGLPGSISFVLTNTNLFVSLAGSDSNSCDSPASACLTINGAIAKASNGDVIKIASGSYTGTGSQVVSLTKSLTLSGGWDAAFNSQTGYSIIDGQGVRAGIQNTSTTSILDRFIIQNGFTTSTGAGINHQQGSLTIQRSVIINNQANNSGGGIYSAGNLTITNSTIRNNSSAYSGGGIAISLSTNSLTLNNSTITSNRANADGGGIALYYSSASGTLGAITIQNSTIVNNTAESNGGGFHNGGGSARPVNITNSILARNTANTAGQNCNGVINIFDHSLMDNVSNCTLANGTGNILNTNPLVTAYPTGPLGLHALQPGSPAISAGVNCLPTDQRGVSRPQGAGCDMGAYEYTAPGTPFEFGIASGANQRTGPSLPFSLPLVVYVVDSLGSPVSGVNVTFNAPASGASGTFASTGTGTATVSTNSEGLATSPVFTANSQLGTYNVTATAAGLGGSLSFGLTNASWFVSVAGNDGNSCSSPAAPCLTINAAITKAMPGDVIKVSAGVYTGFSYSVVSVSKSVTLSGGWNASFNTQTDFSILDGSFGTYDGITISGSNVSVFRFIIRNADYGIYHSGGTLRFEQGALINNNNGIYNYDGDTTFINTTISGNHAGGTAGSAISNVRGTTTIRFSTITNNSGSYAIYSANGYAFIKIGNSILAGNSGVDCYIGSNSSISEGYNIFRNSPACSGSVILQSTDRTGTDPKLLSLVAGSYHPILPGGPAHDAANSAVCPAMDQRGFNRPVGTKCDIGAIEYRAIGTTPAYLIAFEGSGQSIPPGSPATTRLKAAVLDANGDGVPGKTVTFTGPSSGASLVFASTGTYVSTAVTDGNGVATSPAFSANNIRGGYIVSATVVGVASPASFQLYNGGHKAKTYTANNSAVLPGTLLCDQGQPNCTNGVNLHADAAHKYALGTAALYSTQHGRDSIDNNNLSIVSTVHYSSAYDNAFWNGEQMVYGDAHGFPLADDVVAHELTHGVTQYESNLFYYYQSGAINESFSDLWGEYYDQTNGLGNDTLGVRWLMGEDVSGMGIIRSMSNPPIYGDPDKISSPYYSIDANDNGGVHSNSGVNNKAAFLMVDGGTFNGKTVTALGWDKTAAIYYEANANLLSSGADYSDLYYALQTACSNLIGQKGITANNCLEVKDAVDAVEMNGQPVANFNTDAPLCAVGSRPSLFFSDDLETGTSKWSFVNGPYPRWQWDSPDGPYAQSGVHSLYASDYPDTVTDASARLTAVTLPANAYLHFAQAYDFETFLSTSFDGGVLEYSINNGASWADAGPLMDFNGYQGTIYSGSGNPLSGRSAFVGTSHGYTSTRLNLASLAGRTVTFRWRMGLDVAMPAAGWWVDNIKLYTCRPLPGAFSKTAPADGAFKQSPNLTLHWGASTGATAYQYCYDTTNDNACTSWVSNGTSTSKTLSGLSPNTNYYWHVRAINSIGTTYSNGDSTAFWSFSTVGLPGAFNKTAPANGATDISLNTTLSWDISPSASSYQYCYDIIDDDQCNRVWTSASITSAEITNLGTDTTYYWQVRAINAAGTTYADNESWAAFTTTTTLPTGLKEIETFVGTNKQGKYSLEAGQSLRESYGGVNNGPVKIMSMDSTPLIAAERLIYKVNNINTSFTEMMALPNSQLDTMYWLPWYNNVDLDTQLRFANVTDQPATVSVYIGGEQMQGSPFTLAAGESTRKSFPGVNDGPVQIASDQNIVAAERLIYKVNGEAVSFSETMALPNNQLDTTYWLPWYNNKDLDTQLRFANVTGQPATVSVYIGGEQMPGSPFTLAAGESTRKSFPGVNNGPVKIVSNQNLVAAERLIYKVNGANTSFTEMMALPNSQLDTMYWLPWYNNSDLDTQLRFANVHDTQTATVRVYVYGVEMQGSPFTLLPGESTRQSFTGVNNGPVQIVSNVPIVAAERLIYKVNGVNTSFSEMMAISNSQLDGTYWLPWYNNLDLDTQLRFGTRALP